MAGSNLKEADQGGREDRRCPEPGRIRRRGLSGSGQHPARPPVREAGRARPQGQAHRPLLRLGREERPGRAAPQAGWLLRSDQRRRH